MGYFTYLKTDGCFLVPVKGGRVAYNLQLAVYTTYMLPSGGLLYATYHLLREPETTIE